MSLAMLLRNMLVCLLLVTLAAAAVAASPAEAANVEASLALDPAVMPRDWKSIVVHHSATSGGSVAAIDAVHRTQKDSAGKPWLGIGYHFVVGNGQSMADGAVEATFRWREQLPGAHAGRRDQNEHGIGICLIGNFDETRPTERQLASLAALLRQLSRQYSITRSHVLRHQDIHSTQCPGRLFPWEQVLAEVPGADGS
jgi:hypothetical protein